MGDYWHVSVRGVKAISWAILFGASLVLAFDHWLIWSQRWRPMPLLFTIVAVLLSIAAVLAIRRYFTARSDALRVHYRKVAIAERLYDLEDLGYDVVDSLHGPRVHVDHVLIGPGGVYVVQTKVLDRADDSRPLLNYDGERLRADFQPIEPDPLKESHNHADFVRSLLAQWSHVDRQSLPVQSVVLLAGYDSLAFRTEANVWVLDSEVFLRSLSAEPRRLTTAQIEIYADKLWDFAQSLICWRTHEQCVECEGRGTIKSTARATGIIGVELAALGGVYAALGCPHSIGGLYHSDFLAIVLVVVGCSQMFFGKMKCKTCGGLGRVPLKEDA